VVPRKIVWFFLVTALLLEGRAKAQCGHGASFTVCPVADRIYINTDQRLGALRLSDGSVQWQIDLPPREENYAATVATSDVVAVWAGFPDTGIYAFDANTGRPAWRINTSSYGMTAVGRYFVFSDAEHWEALTAVDDRTGKRIWHHSGSRPTRGGVILLVAADQEILTELFAIDGDSGQILRRWPRAWEVSAAALSAKFVAIGTRDAGRKTNKVAAYSLPNYEMLWVRDNAEGGQVEAIATDSDHVLVASRPWDTESFSPGEIRLELLKASSGEAIWTKTISSAGPLASPVGLSQGVAVFATGETPNSGMVQGFDAASGQLKWTVRTDHRIYGVTCAGGTCYLGGELGEVLAIDVHTGAQRRYRIPTQ
jgi:outer membrane protein assembly factor BamB